MAFDFTQNLLDHQPPGRNAIFGGVAPARFAYAQSQRTNDITKASSGTNNALSKQTNKLARPRRKSSEDFA
jgi:hypothetical protein